MRLTPSEKRVFEKLEKEKDHTLYWIYVRPQETRALNSLVKKGLVERIDEGGKRWVLK